jgi:hypothetical protein
VSIHHHRGEGVQIGNGASIANPWAFDTPLFREGVHPLTAGALVGENSKERTIAIKGDTLDAAEDIVHM